MPYTPLIILMADDDIEDLELFEEAIKNVEPGALLHKATNGKDAIDYLASKPDGELPCLIVLDYNMPELNGSEVLQHICREKRYDGIPKVILSTSSTPVHIHECKANGATDYFVKPNNMKDLEILAKRMLAFCN